MAQKTKIQKPASRFQAKDLKGAPFPIFLKISLFILVFGILPTLFFIAWIASSYTHLINEFTGGLVVAHAPGELALSIKNFNAALDGLSMKIGLTFFIFLLAVFSGTLFVSNLITTPIKRLMDGINHLKRGDYSVIFPTFSRDEIGLVAQELNLMIVKLKELRERETALSRAKAELITLTAHQFRTPLSAMKWSLSMIKDADFGNLTPLQKDLFNKTYESNERMIRLISDMLDVVKIEEGRFGLHFQDENIQEVLKDIVKPFEEIASQKNINFKFVSYLESDIFLNCDKSKLGLALNNIIENALNYTLPRGSVTVLIKEGDNSLQIEVQDTGIGIPKKETNKLFTRFFRASNAIKITAFGSGLGLLIAKNIINAHGGAVEVKSREGQGTEVSIFFPIRSDVSRGQTEAPFRELTGG